MDKLFLDANILFSAAYRANAGLLRLWGSVEEPPFLTDGLLDVFSGHNFA